MNNPLNYIALYLLITIMFGMSSAYLYWFISQNIALKREQSKHVAIFFTFISIGLLTNTVREVNYDALAIVISCSCYIIGVFAFRQTLLLRQKNVTTALFKNKWLYLNIIVVVIFLNLIVFYFIIDSLIARVCIMITDFCLILYFSLYQNFQSIKQPTAADKFLMLFVISTPLVNLLFAIIIYSLDIMQWYFTLLLITQILQIFLWAMTFAIILMSDVMDVHYNNSISDGLTGLFNRGYFNEYIIKHTNAQNIFATSNNIQIKNPSTEQYQHGLLFIDIDFFKRINDTHGHSAGDLVIIKIANIIKDSDENSIVARFGGEEFAVFLEYRNRNETLSVAKKIKQLVEDLTIIYEQQTFINVTVSIGVANISDTVDLETALKKADAGLYQAKKTGRNKVCYA